MTISTKHSPPHLVSYAIGAVFAMSLPVQNLLVDVSHTVFIRLNHVREIYYDVDLTCIHSCHHRLLFSTDIYMPHNYNKCAIILSADKLGNSDHYGCNIQCVYLYIFYIYIFYIKMWASVFIFCHPQGRATYITYQLLEQTTHTFINGVRVHLLQPIVLE